jgi:ABC-type polysaccharide transport system permease subunit
MIFAVVVSTILSLPYLYFGWDIYKLILAGASFNIGLNSFITLYGGALNRVPVELNVKAKAFQNTNGFNVTQLLISLPKILAPIIIFYIPYKFISFDAGIIALVLSGLLGLIFQNQFLDLIEKLYQKQKYKTIAAFDEKK